MILSLIKTMQYASAPYVITEEEDNRIRNRRETFIREIGTEKYDFLKKFGYLTYSLYLCRQLQY